MNDNSAKAKIDPADQARVQALNATQWLARLARSYGDQTEEEEVRLRWNNATGRILTDEVAPGIAVGLSLPSLILQFDEDGSPSPHPIDIDGKSSTEVEAWLLVELLHRGIDRDCFSKSLPYRPAQLMSGDEPKYSPQELNEELKRLAKSYEGAAETLARVRGSLKGASDTGKKAADLICWPERMEIGFIVPRFGDDRADGRIKVAFTGADADDTKPCFFVQCAEARNLLLRLDVIEAKKMSSSNVADELIKKVAELRASVSN